MGAGFDDFVILNGHELLRLALMLSGQPEPAEDLVQTVLVKAYRRWDVVAAAERPIAYVRTMLVREHISWRRRMASREIIGAVPDVKAPSNPMDEVDARVEMWSLMATLPRMQRTVLVLRYYEDMSDKQIAEIMGCADGSVRSNASRGIQNLKTRMDPVEWSDQH